MKYEIRVLVQVTYMDDPCSRSPLHCLPLVVMPNGEQIQPAGRTDAALEGRLAGGATSATGTDVGQIHTGGSAGDAAGGLGSISRSRAVGASSPQHHPLCDVCGASKLHRRGWALEGEVHLLGGGGGRIAGSSASGEEESIQVEKAAESQHLSTSVGLPRPPSTGRPPAGSASSCSVVNFAPASERALRRACALVPQTCLTGV